MKKVQHLPLLLKEMGDKVNGVFRRSDLGHLFSTSDQDTLSKRIKSLIVEGYLKRAMQDYYVLPTAQILDLAQRIYPQGYFSLTTAFSSYAMIGTRPTRTATLITTCPRPKNISCDLGTIQMHRVSEEYFFGFEKRGLYNMALPEKAYIDACYLYMKGLSLPFDLSSDVNIAALDLVRLNPSFPLI